MDLFYESFPAPLNQKHRIHFHYFMQKVYVKMQDWHKLHPDSPLRHSADGSKGKETPHITEVVARDLVKEHGWLWCFDEFQVTDVATAVIMRQVLAAMVKLGVVMVVTSNRVPADLYKGGFQRNVYGPFVELLEDRCEVVHLRSETDYREMLMNGEFRLCSRSNKVFEYGCGC
jgi:predicted ATPase